jgi:FkbM family methyltransferase
VVPGLIRELAPAAAGEIVRAARVLRRRGVPPFESWLQAVRLGSSVSAARLPYLPTTTLREARAIVDVGAHDGRWSETVLRVLKPGSLIAIEPNPDSFAHLQRRLHGHRNVRTHRCAVGSTAGTAELLVTCDSHFSSLLRPRPEMAVTYGDAVTANRTVPVEVVTLDHLLADVEFVSLLKIDVQGGERGVLEGGEQTLVRTETILVEVVFAHHYEGDLAFLDLHQELRKRGFTLYSLTPPVYAPDGRSLFTDAVYSLDARLGSGRR